MKIQVYTDPSKRHEDGLAVLSVRVPEQEEFILDLPFKDLYERLGTPDLASLDFLLVASLCYVIDKAVARKTAADNWTRSFEVEIPVSNPKPWGKVASDLQEALCFLTGDIWRLSFRQNDIEVFRPPRRRRRRRRIGVPLMGRPTAVCLFSGGLDSLIGSIDVLSENEDEKLLLIGHYDASGPRSQQKTLFGGMRMRHPRRVDLLQTRVSHKPEAANESTLRSRSLVFMALGIFAARSAGPNVPLYAPENGLIAINIPLTPSRTGSCSTRTMHPFFLDKLRTVLRKLGVKNEIINPLETNTKGECVIQCPDKSLLNMLIASSVSCSHGTRRQHWFRKNANNCGYCVPCLIRRAALHKADLDDGQKYGVDICAGELPINDDGDSADDFRAMLDYLRQNRNAVEIAREIRCIAPVNNPDDLAAMLERGFEEVRTLMRDKALPALREMAGIH